MNTIQFQIAMKSNDFEQTIRAIREALEDYSNGMDIEEYEDILLNSLELNPKLDFLIDSFGNPFQGGQDSLYENNESMIQAFEDMNYLEMSEQQQIILEKLKGEEFFDITAANAVIVCQPQIDLVKPDVYSNLNIDDCKAILNVLDIKQNFEYVSDNLDLAILGMVRTSELGNYDEKSNTNLFKSTVAFLNLNSFGLKFDEAYSVLMENSAENDKLDAKILDKIFNKVVDPENVIKPKFSLLDLERLKGDIDSEYNDDIPDEDAPKKKRRLTI